MFSVQLTYGIVLISYVKKFRTGRLLGFNYEFFKLGMVTVGSTGAAEEGPAQLF